MRGGESLASGGWQVLWIPVEQQTDRNEIIARKGREQEPFGGTRPT